jgi:hypothetical protein
MFLLFSTQFTIISKMATLLKLWFTPRPLDLLQSSQVCPRFTEKSLEKTRSLQLGPRGVGRRRPCRIPATWRPGVGGEGGGGLVAHLGLVLVGRRGHWKARRGSSAAPGVGHHGGGEFRRGRGEVGQRAAGEASTGSQGGAGWLDGDEMKGKAPFTEQHPWWPAAGHEAVGGGVSCGEVGAAAPF